MCKPGGASKLNIRKARCGCVLASFNISFSSLQDRPTNAANGVSRQVRSAPSSAAALIGFTEDAIEKKMIPSQLVLAEISQRIVPESDEKRLMKA